LFLRRIAITLTLIGLLNKWLTGKKKFKNKKDEKTNEKNRRTYFDKGF
jgi:plastocyanin domain-containing protein